MVQPRSFNQWGLCEQIATMSLTVNIFACETHRSTGIIPMFPALYVTGEDRDDPVYS